MAADPSAWFPREASGEDGCLPSPPPPPLLALGSGVLSPGLSSALTRTPTQRVCWQQRR